jgi:hypothetical protein
VSRPIFRFAKTQEAHREPVGQPTQLERAFAPAGRPIRQDDARASFRQIELPEGARARELEAIAALAEWCDDDCQLLEQARANVLRDTRKATLSAQGVIAQNNRDALELLELVARAS